MVFPATDQGTATLIWESCTHNSGAGVPSKVETGQDEACFYWGLHLICGWSILPPLFAWNSTPKPDRANPRRGELSVPLGLHRPLYSIAVWSIRTGVQRFKGGNSLRDALQFFTQYSERLMDIKGHRFSPDNLNFG